MGFPEQSRDGSGPEPKTHSVGAATAGRLKDPRVSAARATTARLAGDPCCRIQFTQFAWLRRSCAESDARPQVIIPDLGTPVPEANASPP